MYMGSSLGIAAQTSSAALCAFHSEWFDSVSAGGSGMTGVDAVDGSHPKASRCQKCGFANHGEIGAVQGRDYDGRSGYTPVSRAVTSPTGEESP